MYNPEVDIQLVCVAFVHNNKFCHENVCTIFEVSRLNKTLFNTFWSIRNHFPYCYISRVVRVGKSSMVSHGSCDLHSNKTSFNMFI